MIHSHTEYLHQRDWYKEARVHQVTPLYGEASSQWDNKPCCCGNSHLLHSKKNQIVLYDGGVWAYECYVQVRMIQLMDLIDVYQDEIDRNKKLNNELGLIIQDLSAYTNHMSYCKAIEASEAGRVAKCTCGHDELYAKTVPIG